MNKGPRRGSGRCSTSCKEAGDVQSIDATPKLWRKCIDGALAEYEVSGSCRVEEDACNNDDDDAAVACSKRQRYGEHAHAHDGYRPASAVAGAHKPSCKRRGDRSGNACKGDPRDAALRQMEGRFGQPERERCPEGNEGAEHHRVIEGTPPQDLGG